MMRIGIGVFAFSVLAAGPVFAGKPAKPTVVAAAPTEAKKPADAKPADTKPAEVATAGESKPGDTKPAETKPADAAKPAAKPKGDSLNDLLEEAGKSGATEVKIDEAAKKKAEAEAAAAKKKAEEEKLNQLKKQAAKVAPKATQGPTGDAPAPTDTNDNDDSEEAAKVTALVAVKQEAKRHIGPYEIGPLDCRQLDGAGIERVLKKKMIAGEEPDVLCRVIVTQPGDVVSAEHSVNFSVLVGGKETWRQQRKVRMSSIGRRALVFVVPMDKIAPEEATPEGIPVTFSAVLSSPAKPANGSEFKIKVIVED